MKKYLYLLLLLLGISFAPQARSQGLLGIGGAGIYGLPSNNIFGDTLNSLGVWVVNRGATALSGLQVGIWGFTSHNPIPFQAGMLDLTLGILQPGDSTYVPLDYFVVSTQNSNQGSNVMVIWPTAPGSQPSDSANGEYYVDPPTATADGAAPLEKLTLWPNPCHDILHMTATPDASQFQIWDGAGRLVLNGAIPAGHMDLSPLPAGNYTIRISNRKGHSLAARQLIKE